MNTSILGLTCAFIGSALSSGITAAELTHTFVNPDFGGSPLNGSYLLSNASAQNNHTAKPKTTPTTASTNAATAVAKQTDAERFQQLVNNLVLSTLAGRVVEQSLGESGVPESGTINTGVNTITIQAVEGGTQVTIVDNNTGGKSVITIPTY
jgi:curli production assembly/transport component CsgF